MGLHSLSQGPAGRCPCASSLSSFLHFLPQCPHFSPCLCACLSLVFRLALSLHLPPHFSLHCVLLLCLHVPCLDFLVCVSVPLLSHLCDLPCPEPSPSLLCCHCLPAPAFLSLHLSWVCPSPSFRSFPKLAQPWPASSLVAARPLLVLAKFRCRSLGQ